MEEAVEGVSERLRIRGASLPKARQWLVWLAYHFPELPADHGWAALARDTLIGLHHAIVTTARRLRGNPTWDLQGTMTADTERLEDQAERLARQAAQLVLRPDIPDHFRPLVQLLEGACKQHVRLAREVDLLEQGGAIQVDVSLDPSARTLVEVG
jgi:hypothetical protein